MMTINLYQAVLAEEENMAVAGSWLVYWLLWGVDRLGGSNR